MKVNYLIFLIMVFSGCVSSENDKSYIQRLYAERNIEFDDDTEFCIVLPEVGCAGCISGTLYNILENKSSFSNTQKKNLIVFTAVNSPKMLIRNVQVDSLSELNCILDKENKYLLDTKNKIYPLMMTLHNGKITNVMIQSPDHPENVFDKLFKKE